MRTDWGLVEYAERGAGEPVLVSHGIFHGCDGGLLATREEITGLRVIVPSRFGYLGSAMPADASAAEQADAFVALLDLLEITRADVVGISAGTGAALQTALRHPGRVGHLVVSSGNWPGSPTAQAPPQWAKAFYSDPAMWAMRTFVPPMMGRLMGVPVGFPRDENDARRMEEMLESIFPLEPRREGAVFDAFVSNPQVGEYPLEDITVPTLVIHAADDPLASPEAAAAAAGRIPAATLVSLPSGGHLGLGQTGRVREEISGFLET
ncbi:alpha/beta fold hydrolase [Nostocoides sp. F2B08]|uniref:alpha/beta fold hydrolase n=1 Tax=Nostocoides sp. F2B08 TaxID=2653936 RepID=UPI001D05AE34|nr:alpha/beta hydrolase [Tetrasphaera sp. F2B08]